MRVCFVSSQFQKLGIEYLSAALEAAGHETCLAYDPRLFVDSFVIHERLARLASFEAMVVDAAAELDADLYAFSILSADWAWARRLTSAIRERTGKPVVVGGLHVSAATATVLEHEGIDYTVTGEAEQAFVELVDTLAAGGDPAGIPNVGVKRGGEMQIEPNRALLEDLDELPFPNKALFHDVSRHFQQGYNIMAARGCPKSCSYCFNSWYKHQFPNKRSWVRHRSVENVLKELEVALAADEVDHLRLVDDDLLVNAEWFREFAEHYRERIGLPYRAFVDADSCTEELVRLLEASGCFEVELGVQTIKHDIRKQIFTRGQVAGQCKKAIEYFGATTVDCVADNILGYPGQSPDDMAELIAFYDETRPSRIQNLWLRYWPGATIVDIAHEHGYLSRDEVDEVYRNPSDRSCTVGNVQKDEWMKNTSAFLYLSLHMPHWFNRWWIVNNRFTHFPRLPVFVSYLITNISGAKFNMYGARFSRRYFKFGCYRLLRLLGERPARLIFGRDPLRTPDFPSGARRARRSGTPGSTPEAPAATAPAPSI